jgi:hypothetical protein
MEAHNKHNYRLHMKSCINGNGEIVSKSFKSISSTLLYCSNHTYASMNNIQATVNCRFIRIC